MILEDTNAIALDLIEHPVANSGFFLSGRQTTMGAWIPVDLGMADIECVVEGCSDVATHWWEDYVGTASPRWPTDTTEKLSVCRDHIPVLERYSEIDNRDRQITYRRGHVGLFIGCADPRCESPDAPTTFTDNGALNIAVAEVSGYDYSYWRPACILHLPREIPLRGSWRVDTLQDQFLATPRVRPQPPELPLRITSADSVDWDSEFFPVETGLRGEKRLRVVAHGGAQHTIQREDLDAVLTLMRPIGMGMELVHGFQVLTEFTDRRPLNLNELIQRRSYRVQELSRTYREYIGRKENFRTKFSRVTPVFPNPALMAAMASEVRTWPEVIDVAGPGESLEHPPHTMASGSEILIRFCPVFYDWGSDWHIIQGLTVPMVFSIDYIGNVKWVSDPLGYLQGHPHAYEGHGDICGGNGHFGAGLAPGLQDLREWIPSSDGGPANPRWQTAALDWWEANKDDFLAEFPGAKAWHTTSKEELPELVDLSEIVDDAVALMASAGTEICANCDDRIPQAEAYYCYSCDDPFCEECFVFEEERCVNHAGPQCIECGRRTDGACDECGDVVCDNCYTIAPDGSIYCTHHSHMADEDDDEDEEEETPSEVQPWNILAHPAVTLPAVDIWHPTDATEGYHCEWPNAYDFMHNGTTAPSCREPAVFRVPVEAVSWQQPVPNFLCAMHHELIVATPDTVSPDYYLDESQGRCTYNDDCNHPPRWRRHGYGNHRCDLHVPRGNSLHEIILTGWTRPTVTEQEVMPTIEADLYV